MERLLFAYAGVGLATGAAALALLALAPFWEKRYAARFRCIVWLALAVRLLVPFAAPLPAAAPQPLLLELPASLPDTARAGETQAAGAPTGQAAGTGESVASVPQASGGNKGSLWNGTGGAAGTGCRRAVCTGGRADGGFRSITQNSRSPLRRDPSSCAGAAGRLCVAGGRGRMCAVAPCALCGMARPHVPLEPADGKLCGAKGSRRGLPGGAYAPRTGDICQCRRAVPYGRGRAASGGAGPGGPV